MTMHFADYANRPCCMSVRRNQRGRMVAPERMTNVTTDAGRVTCARCQRSLKFKRAQQ